jgi:hypothetical protein
MRLLGFLLFLISLGGLYLLLGYASTGELGIIEPGKIDFATAPSSLGKRAPADMLLLMASIFVMLWGLKWLVVGRSKGPTPPPKPDDPSDERAMRKYEIQMSTFRPAPRMPMALLLNSYAILTLIISLFFATRGGENHFLLGAMGAVLGLALVFGLIMLVLAKIEKSLGSGGGLIGLLVHLGGLGVVAAAVVLRLV